MLQTQADVVDALGGPAAFADATGVSRTAPYNYAAGVRWPLHVLCKVIALCADARLRLHPDLTARLPDDVLAGIALYSRLYRVRGHHGK